MFVVGVDGCPVGWVAARVEIQSGSRPRILALKTYISFEEVVDASEDADAIAVDIPIGLIECQRAADIETRRVLGKRKSSVFPAPDPRVVDIENYWEANRLMRQYCGKGISKQAFALFPKVREVNDVVRRRDPAQETIIEIHPEVCFWAMNGEEAMDFPKRDKDGNGYRERVALLKNWLELPLWKTSEEARQQAKGAGADDVLDAMAAAWTARRWATGPKEVGWFPAIEQRDKRGLRAEIVY